MKLIVAGACALVLITSVSGCGGSDGTTRLKAAGGAVIPLRVTADQLGDNTFVRMRGFYVCTSGDDEVSITGASLLDATGTKTTGFSVTRAPQDDLPDDATWSTETSGRPLSTDTAPSPGFRQTCDDGPGTGSTFVTVDSQLGALPVESRGVQLTYRVGEQTKDLTVDASIVVCGASSACPVDPEEES